MKPVYMIVACSENRVIGMDGRLPWKIPEDAQYYVNMTRGGIVIHGRRCYEESGHALPDRMTIVLTRDADRTYPDAETAPGLPAALEQAQAMAHPGPIWIAGGEAVYREGLAHADRLYLTLIHAEFEGDTRFPEWDPPFSRVLSERKSRQGDLEFTFFVLERESQ